MFHTATCLVSEASAPQAPHSSSQRQLPVCFAFVKAMVEPSSGRRRKTSVLALNDSMVSEHDIANRNDAMYAWRLVRIILACRKTRSVVADHTSAAAIRGATMFWPNTRKLAAYQT